MIKKIPKIRFKEFDEEWYYEVLGNLVEKQKSDLKVSEIKTDGNVDIYGIDGKIGKSFLRETFNKDIVIISKDGSVGKLQILPKNSWFTSTLEGIFIKEKSLINNNFLYLVLNNIKFDEFVVGTSIPHLYFNDYKNLNIFLPSLNEQKKISKLVFSLDSFIKLIQQKLDFFYCVKQTFLSKMFPDQNSKFPNIRFSEFTHAWEQGFLSSVVSIQNGKLNANKMEISGKYNFYTSGREIFKINTWSFEGETCHNCRKMVLIWVICIEQVVSLMLIKRTYVLKTEIWDTDFLYFNLLKNLWIDIQRKISNGGIPFIVYNDISQFIVTSLHSWTTKNLQTFHFPRLLPFTSSA
ncbi:restriction endonuclease subunit S [Mycoplasma sp. 6243]|uniref:restriction endonuclease subunit S n=1 Tax=Mycoplasma sp. 6243 TaxID=3440865 RepID=UPI003EB86815